jgi:hypothetical protein
MAQHRKKLVKVKDFLLEIDNFAAMFMGLSPNQHFLITSLQERHWDCDSNMIVARIQGKTQIILCCC